MPERLPLYINPERAAARGLEASGEFMLEKMDRIYDRLLAPYGKVEVAFKFGKEGRRKYVSGHITGEMIIECQRCMSKLTKIIDHRFQLGLIETEAEMDSLLPGEEPLMISNEDLFLADVVEDELELLLPMVVMHEAGECAPHESINALENTLNESHVKAEVDSERNDVVLDEVSGTKDKRPNPFLALAALKSSKD